MSELKRKKRTRGGHRAYVNKTLADAKNCLEEKSDDENEQLRRAQLRTTLGEVAKTLKGLDEEILDMLTNDDDVQDEEIAHEVEEAGRLRSELQTAVLALEKVDAGKTTERQSEGASATEQRSVQDSAKHEKRTISAKLPQLEIKPFSGRAEDWQAFWDCFESSVDMNDRLSTINKFSYLRSFLEGQARAAIAGFSLTAVNYGAAVELLKRRFGKKTTIQRAHISNIMKVSAVHDEKDTRGLRRIHDTIEAHHRGLQALGVESSSYDAIVVPAVLGKIPEVVRLTITRGKQHEEWTMDEMLAELLGELELREDYVIASQVASSKTSYSSQEGSRGSSRTNWKAAEKSSGWALHAGAEVAEKCAYCLGKHEHERCEKVTEVKERKQLLRGYP